MAHTAGKSAYDMLGVSPGDDSVTIRRAWRALVRAYHPDAFQGDKAAANAILADLNAAYDAIQDDAADRNARRAAQAARREAARRAERARQAEERRKAEAARKAEAERRAEAVHAAKMARQKEAARRAEMIRREEAAQSDNTSFTARISRRLTEADRAAARAAVATFEAARKVLSAKALHTDP